MYNMSDWGRLGNVPHCEQPWVSGPWLGNDLSGDGAVLEALWDFVAGCCGKRSSMKTSGVVYRCGSMG